MNILFLAPPAAGKGTQSMQICKQYGLIHISTGDLLRNCEDENIAKLIKNGEFVSDEIVTSLLENKLVQKECDKGYVLDGYPRNIKQAKLYDDLLVKLGKDEGVVIVLDLDKEIAKKRIVGRRICPNCGAVFNDYIKEALPKVDNLCDYCHHSLIKRDDDNEDTFNKRYAIYENETKPLIEYYKNKGILYYVDSGVDIDYTFRQVQNIIDNKLARR